jgi:hypothetical protein
MKAEHRHQLQTNALADRMGRLLQGVKSAPKSTATLVWVLVLLILATFAIWKYAASDTGTERSNDYARMDEATHDDPTAGAVALQAIETRRPSSLPARAARFQLARASLQQGLGSLATDDRVGALPMLRSARTLYSELVPRCADVPLLAQEAMLGKATAEESLAGIVEAGETTPTSPTTTEQDKEEKRAGSLDKAVEYYLDLARKYPDTGSGAKAEERAKELQDPDSRSKIEQLYAEANKKAAPKANIPIKPVSP